MVVEACFGVAFLAGVAVALGRLGAGPDRLVGRAAVGVVLLVRDHLRALVELEDGRVEVVGELVADQLGGAGVLPCGAGLDQGDTVLVVEDVQRLALQDDRGVGAVLAVDLKGAEIDPLGFPRGPRPLVAACSVTLRTRCPAAS